MTDTSTFSAGSPIPDPRRDNDQLPRSDVPAGVGPSSGTNLAANLDSAAMLDSAPRFLRFQSNWGNLVGMGYGLREPVALGGVRVELPKEVDFEELDATVIRYITEEVPDELRDGSPAEQLVKRTLHWTGALQREVRIPVFGRAYVGPSLERERGGVSMRLAVPYFLPAATSTALSFMSDAVNNFIATGRLTPALDRDTEKRLFEAVITKLREYLPGGINTYRFLAAAHDNDIPAHQFIPSVYAFGVGVHTRWLQSSLTDRTAFIGARIAGSKLLTAHMLRRAGLPAPRHAQARSEEQAVRIANRLGFPVVVKPADRAQGEGVTTDLRSDEAVVSAFRSARSLSPNVLVEKHFEGTDYRLTVLNGELIDVFGRTAGGVYGDGEHSIAELVDIARSQPNYIMRVRERGVDALTIDDEARTLLAEAGLTTESVPADSEYVKLRRRGNLSAGGTRQALGLDEIHPDNRRLAERAVAALRLDLGGVDVIMPDIARSWMETGAIICEVNAQPQLGRSMALDVLKTSIPGDGRIPIVLVVGRNGCIDWERLRGRMQDSNSVGFSSSDGAWLGSEQLTSGKQDGFGAARILFDNPLTEAAIVVIGPNEIVRMGLPADSFDAIILDSPDNWSQEGRNSTTQMLEMAMPHAKRLVSLRSSHPLFVNESLMDKWEAASGPIVEDVCLEVVQDAIANAGTTVDVVED